MTEAIPDPEAVKRQAQLDRALFDAAGTDSDEDLARLVELGASGKAADSTGKTALMRVAIRGDAKMAAILLPVSDANQVDQYGVDALMAAANAGRAECVELLIAAGDARQKTRQGETALIFAAAGGHAKCVELLISNSDPTAVESDGWTALVHAALAKSPACVEMLLPSSDIGKRCHKGMTPLMWAARMGDLKCVQAIAAKSAEAGLLHAIDRRGLGASDHARAAFHEEAAACIDAMTQRREIAAAIPDPIKMGPTRARSL